MIQDRTHSSMASGLSSQAIQMIPEAVQEVRSIEVVKRTHSTHQDNEASSILAKVRISVSSDTQFG